MTIRRANTVRPYDSQGTTKTRSAKSHQNRRADVESRPYKRGDDSSPPTHALQFCFSIGTVKTVPYNFSFFIIHYSSIFGAPSRRPLRSHCIFIFQSERSRPFPTIFHYSFFIIHPFSGRRVMAAPLPLCRYATFPLTGESHRPLRTHCSFIFQSERS